MAQASVWYDTCPVCQGRGAIPCSECGGSGHNHGAGHAQFGLRLGDGDDQGMALLRMARIRTTVARARSCAGCTCESCGGRGATACTACHGQGMRGLPAYIGTYY
jgi:hypothetical protein